MTAEAVTLLTNSRSVPPLMIGCEPVHGHLVAPVVGEGNHYFPPESLHQEYFTTTRAWSVCPWKGLARYYTIVVDGNANMNGAWYYPHPSPLARKIKGHVAFWNGVRIEGEPEPREPRKQARRMPALPGT